MPQVRRDAGKLFGCLNRSGFDPEEPRRLTSDQEGQESDAAHSRRKAEHAAGAGKRGRLWRNDGACIRLRPEHKDHVWSYDIVFDRTHDGRPLRQLTVIDEYTRECLAVEVARRQDSESVLEPLGRLFVDRGVPDHIRSDNGPEFTATAAREWLGRLDVKTLLIEPDSPWENGYCESFNGKLREELFDREIFYTLEDARVLIELWRREYNHFQPNSSPGSRPPAPETRLPAEAAFAPLSLPLQACEMAPATSQELARLSGAAHR